jgi:cytochrome c-type biogenesis protein CcmH/NrfF
VTYLWVIPVVLIVVVSVLVFWMVIKRKGGSGVRTRGETLVDKRSDGDVPGDKRPRQT